MFFDMFFSVQPLWGWNVLEAERLLCSWRHIDWRNTKICLHGASRMELKHGKSWKLPIFEEKLWIFISYLIIYQLSDIYSSTFYSLFLPFFVLEIFKFKYNKVFIRHSASISKFEWSHLSHLRHVPLVSIGWYLVTWCFCYSCYFFWVGAGWNICLYPSSL